VLQAIAFSSAALRLVMVPSSSASRPLTLSTGPLVVLPPVELRLILLPAPAKMFWQQLRVWSAALDRLGSITDV